MPEEYQFAYSETETITRLGVEREIFKQSIRPLMEKSGHARRPERCWMFDGRYLWQWQLYIATRRNLIEARVWNSKRAYSAEEMEEISLGDAYEEYRPKPEAK